MRPPAKVTIRLEQISVNDGVSQKNNAYQPVKRTAKLELSDAHAPLFVSVRRRSTKFKRRV
jgi:hypothetical protein